jgi:hypothetical protein
MFEVSRYRGVLTLVWTVGPMIGFGLPLLPPALMTGAHHQFADILFSLYHRFVGELHTRSR